MEQRAIPHKGSRSPRPRTSPRSSCSRLARSRSSGLRPKSHRRNCFAPRDHRLHTVHCSSPISIELESHKITGGMKREKGGYLVITTMGQFHIFKTMQANVHGEDGIELDPHRHPPIPHPPHKSKLPTKFQKIPYSEDRVETRFAYQFLPHLARCLCVSYFVYLV